MISYVISTAKDGTIRLSKRGHWGNIAQASMEEAEAEAERDARKKPFQIERITLKL